MKEEVITMWRLGKRIPINFAECRSYRHGGKLLLLLAAFVTLSLILSVVGTGGMPSNLPLLFAQTEDPPPPPLGAPPVAGPFNGTLAHPIALDRGQINVQDFDAEARFFNPPPTTSSVWIHGFRFRLPGEAYYQVSIHSNGGWIHHMITNNEEEAELVDRGTSDATDTSEGRSNLLKLMVRGDRGWFYINNRLAAILDVRHSVRLNKAGDVGVFARGLSLSGETRYEGFTVRAEAKVVPMSDPSVYGPVKGALVRVVPPYEILTSPQVRVIRDMGRAEVNVRDFDTEARFFNPYATTSENWNHGFLFGLEGTFYAVLIDSDGNWKYHLQQVDGPLTLDQGTSDAIDTSEGRSNLLKLMVRGDTGWLYVNNQLAAILDLISLSQAGTLFEGDVGVIASGSSSGETQVEGFTVWAEANVVPMGGLPVAGPFYGELVHDEDGLTEESSAGVNVQDFDAEVRFFNPYPTTRGPWHYGFAFRGVPGGTFYAVLIDSDGNWKHDIRHVVNPLAQGTSDVIDTSEGGSNRLRLVVRGDRAGSTSMINWRLPWT
jgi:hypothetical protein